MAGRRYNCRCGKKRYRDELSAMAAAAADEQEHGDVVSVYRCPGGLAWHLTAHGFVPEALRSVGRRVAYEFLERGEIDLGTFLTSTYGAHDGPGQRRRIRAERCVEQMTALHLVRPAGSPGRFVAADRAGLARVVRIGMDAFLEEGR
ncbi:hypothetical protein AB0G04_32685 [Actinoplanes sp. NPDC023801]|uniref:hypothetical protein n=1 Tax=Actinoplanes sp. NPDC023801 TaxID=3154595 RepID=UPI003409CF3A